MEEEEQRKKEVEEKMVKAQREAEELRENAKQKSAFIDKVLKQKEESETMNQKLFMEISKLHKDLEQKGKVLSAMLRKSKLDSAEKKMLLKEVKLLKARRKQAEQETEKWRAVSDERYKRHSLPKSYDELTTTAKEKRLEDWVKAEAENYATMIENRHHLELDAFAEELSDKDEKIETFHWQLLRVELETRKLQSHVEGLIKEVSQLRHEKMNLETLLIEREEELTSLKEKFTSHLISFNCYEHNLLLPSQEMKETLIGSAENDVQSHSEWKMDLHAFGVSYKIKRLKQQLVLVERLTVRQANGESIEFNDDINKAGLKTYLSLTSLLNKQVGRYQCLQEKINSLCKRMYENNIYATTKEKTETLEEFLEETFQLQRYIVGTGQRLLELQSKVVSGFSGVAKEMEKSAGIAMKRFADSIRTLSQEIQRGLEIRTARIIGDLERSLSSKGTMLLGR